MQIISILLSELFIPNKSVYGSSQRLGALLDCTAKLICNKRDIFNMGTCSKQVTKLRSVICYLDRLDALPHSHKFPQGPSFHFSLSWI